MDEQRLVDLETRLAYQEEALRVLDEVITQQQQRIAELEHTCRQLRERLSARQRDAQSAAPADEVPPHY
jgi:SlyX protein